MITVNLRALLSYEIESKQFGLMLVPVILEKLPDDIRLEVNRKMNGEDWDLDNLIRILILEIEAREACNTNQADSIKELSVHNRKVRGITTESLHVGNRVLRCVFCDLCFVCG